MDSFTKIITLSLITVILGLVLSRDAKEMALLVSVAACSLVGLAAFSYLSPVLAFLDTLTASAGISGEMLQILLKATGVGLLGELTGLICTDAGNATIAKLVQLAAVMVILWISLPLYEGILDMIRQVMEGL